MPLTLITYLHLGIYEGHMDTDLAPLLIASVNGPHILWAKINKERPRDEGCLTGKMAVLVFNTVEGVNFSWQARGKNASEIAWVTELEGGAMINGHPRCRWSGGS